MDGLVIGDVFRNAARAAPRATAAVHGDRGLTFGGLDADSDRLAGALQGRGIGVGDRVLTWAGTSLDAVVLFAALAKLGAVYVPIAGNLGREEAERLIRLARPRVVIVDGEPAFADVLRLSELSAAAGAADVAFAPPVVDEADAHVIFFTSGSTGDSKGVVLSHRVNHLRTHAGALPEPRGPLVCVYPLFHMAAWTLSLQQWQARGAVVYVDQPDGRTIVDAIRHHDAERINAVPAVWRRILDHLGPGATLPSLHFADTGTSTTPPALLAAIAAAAPAATVRVFYGSTEAGNVASLVGDDLASHPHSCGAPSVSAQVRLDDGELCVRGPLLFDGYFDDPAATAAALRDGWFHTGDLATVDADGYLSIVGRCGEVIRSGGEAVVPAEVEAVLAELGTVAEVAVVGVPDESWGEVVCAVVVPREASGPPTLEEIRAHCAGRLAAFKHPRRLELRSDLPRTAATGQVQRRLLAQELAGRATVRS